MDKKVTLDPTKITFDGRGFSAVITDEKAFKKRLKKLRRQALRDLKRK